MNKAFNHNRTSFFPRVKSKAPKSPSEAEVKLVDSTLGELESTSHQLGSDIERWSLQYRTMISEMSFDVIKERVFNSVPKSSSQFGLSAVNVSIFSAGNSFISELDAQVERESGLGGDQLLSKSAYQYPPTSTTSTNKDFSNESKENSCVNRKFVQQSVNIFPSSDPNLLNPYNSNIRPLTSMDDNSSLGDMSFPVIDCDRSASSSHYTTNIYT